MPKWIEMMSRTHPLKAGNNRLCKTAYAENYNNPSGK